MDNITKLGFVGQILLVEDDEDLIVHFLWPTLKQFGTVTAIPFASKAMRALELVPLFDLVVLDYHLINGTGLEVMKKVFQTQRDPRVITISADSSWAKGHSEFRKDALFFLPKPFSTKELEEVVRLALGLHR